MTPTIKSAKKPADEEAVPNPRLEAAKERLRRPDPFREGGNGCCYPESCPATRALLRVLENKPPDTLFNAFDQGTRGQWESDCNEILAALEEK